MCHRLLLHIGFWQDATTDQKIKVVEHLNSRYKNELELFEESDQQVVAWVNHSWNLMIDKKTIDRKTMEQKHRLAKTYSIKNKEAREIGTEWICANTWNKLMLTELFEDLGWSQEKIQLAMTQIISRSVYPGSELATSKCPPAGRAGIKDNSAICDITGYDINKITKDKLYESALHLYKHKDAIEKHLSTTTNELFDLQDRIMLYDLTNTYFEGSKRNSNMAKYGRSKEKRSDAKLVVLAMVINIEGFIKYSAIHEGNFSDTTDINPLLQKLSVATSNSTKPIVVMDAGIATEDNIKILNQQGYQYLVVSRTKLKDYQLLQQGKQTCLLTNSKKLIRLAEVQSQKHTDRFF